MAKTRRGTSVAKGKTPAERCAGRRRSPGSADRPPVERPREKKSRQLRCSLDIITHGIPDVEDEPCGVAWMDGIEIFHGQRHACACDLGHRRPQVKGEGKAAAPRIVVVSDTAAASRSAGKRRVR
uniref:Uncharacterized protein n=1 Tax=Oryza barthii TaxID=65489 RepID=A0A0D3H733_9ORYZ